MSKAKKNDEDTRCPMCAKQHTANTEPSLGEVLGPCADAWWGEALAEAGLLKP